MTCCQRLWKAFQSTRVGRSIFRVGLPASNLERAQAAISSFLLHVQPAKVNRRVLKFRTTLGLGLISLYLFLILTVTGVLLMFYYVPATDYAYQNMKDLEFVVTAGLVLRNMHRWAAHLMVLFVVLHMCRVFYTGAYKTPARVQLGAGRDAVSVDAGLVVHRLPVAVGPACLLGHYGRHHMAAQEHELEFLADDRRVAGDAGADRDGPIGKLVPRQQVTGERQRQRQQKQHHAQHPVELARAFCRRRCRRRGTCAARQTAPSGGPPSGACCAAPARP